MASSDDEQLGGFATEREPRSSVVADTRPAQPVAASVLPTGQLVAGKYRVEGLIGRGGMGRVYAAVNELTGRRLALKWLRADASRREEANARFLREARVAARVEHPNVIDVYDVGREQGALFLVMELLEGEPLSERFSRGRIPPQELSELILPAMRGVAAAHRMSVVHRDIKPDNIFLCSDPDGLAAPSAKVLDFGVSKLLKPDLGGALGGLTETGQAIGTPHYMPLEQLRGHKNVDHRADIYAFGALLFEGLTGRRPFVAETLGDLLLKTATEDPPLASGIVPELPRQLDRVLSRALARDPEDRQPDLDTLIREFSEAVASADSPASAEPAAGLLSRPHTEAMAEPQSPRRSPSSWRRVRRGVVAATLLLVALVAAQRLAAPPSVSPAAQGLEGTPDRALKSATVAKREMRGTNAPPAAALAPAPPTAALAPASAMKPKTTAPAAASAPKPSPPTQPNPHSRPPRKPRPRQKKATPAPAVVAPAGALGLEDF